jgi:alpha-L-fucosidase
MNVRKGLFVAAWTLAMTVMAPSVLQGVETMDKMWGASTPKTQATDTSRGSHFRRGHYGLFMHWGLYSQLAGQWKGKTYYGIGEWIMNPAMAGIPVADYTEIAKTFNPDQFNAKAIVQMAKDAGMTYVIITSKHHEGFAMFKSAHPFNIVDASPFARDPMKELAAACREAGLGFGFYYSHNQDWTAPGGAGGPKTNPDGSPATFGQYFREKCYPQVKEICTQYGPLEVVWFDTPGDMPKEHVVELHNLVRATQPKALLGSRIGYGLGDYETLGDMEVPAEKVGGLWESCDTSNDSWAYAWYDTNWKEPREILKRLVATVARGGNYLLNVGPDGKGAIPGQCQKFMKEAGCWIKANPGVITGAGPSPWNHAMPWGDVTMQGDKTLHLVVFDPPRDGIIYLPGLTTRVKSATWISGAGTSSSRNLDPSGAIMPEVFGSGYRLKLPAEAAVGLASVIRVELAGKPEVDTILALHPNLPNTLLAHFAEATGAEKKKVSWMEKFGEWKHANQISHWAQDGRARWTVNVLEPGAYKVSLKYRGKGRAIWKIITDEGAVIQNQQAATSQYQAYPMGVFEIRKAGARKIDVALVDGDRDDSSLESMVMTRVQ